MAPDTANGRATLARISAQIEAQSQREDEHHLDLKADISKACDLAEKNSARIGALERRVDVNDEQHKAMKRDSTIVSTIQMFAAAIVGFVGPKG